MRGHIRIGRLLLLLVACAFAAGVQAQGRAKLCAACATVVDIRYVVFEGEQPPADVAAGTIVLKLGDGHVVVID